MSEFLQFVGWLIVLSVVPVCAAVWLLSVRYRDGRIVGPWRAAYLFLCALAAWYVAMVVVAWLAGNTAAAVLLSVAWAIGVLSWGAIALGNLRARQPQPAAGPPAYDAFAQTMARKRRAYAAYTRTI